MTKWQNHILSFRSHYREDHITPLRQKGHGAGCSDAHSWHCQRQCSSAPDTSWSKLSGLRRGWSSWSCVDTTCWWFIKVASSLLHSTAAHEYIKMLVTPLLRTLISAVLHNWVHKNSSHEDLGTSNHHLNCFSSVVRWISDANIWPQMKWALNCLFTKLFSSLLFFIFLPSASNRSLKLPRTYSVTDKGWKLVLCTKPFRCILKWHFEEIAVYGNGTHYLSRRGNIRFGEKKKKRFLK